MMAHFFRLNEGTNFYLKHFSLNPIFTPLEGVIPPKWGKSTWKWLSLPPYIKTPKNMNAKHIVIHISLSGPNLSQFNRVGILTPIYIFLPRGSNYFPWGLTTKNMLLVVQSWHEGSFFSAQTRKQYSPLWRERLPQNGENRHVNDEVSICMNSKQGSLHFGERSY